MKQDMIVILDLGSHENTVLARAIRALGVYSEIYPHDITVEELKALPNVKGIIINGGLNNVIDGVAIDVNPSIYTMGIPVMAAGHDKATCAVKLPAFTDDIEAIKAAIKSFVFDTCQAEANWNMANFVNDQIELIRRQVGDKKVLLALSGGVDSSVVAGGAKKTILIVEDHKDIRLYLKVLFGNEYNLLMATNGQEGVDTAMKEMPDLIICDVMMPVKDGFECCREVKENPETCSIPFIMLTAKVEDDDIIHGLQLGADDYVLKPFTPGILKAKVSSLINGRQTLKQMYTKLFKLPGTDTIVVSEPEQAGEEVKTEDPFITAVIKIVEENICEADFSVKKLAAEMNMSQPTLYRKVKQSTDYTIIELIRGVRMRRAGVLLKTKQYAVQEVAEMVGYNDIPTFRKHFVDAFGTTPSTYE